MKNRLLKTVPVLICALFAAMIFVGCTMTFDKYDDENYIRTSNSNSEYLSSQTTTNEGVNWQVKSFGGVKTLKNNVTLESNAVLNITLEYIGGRFKIVAIAGDSLYTLIENESCDGLSTELESGIYTIKAVGDNAEFKSTYKL